MITDDSFIFQMSNGFEDALNLLATRSTTRPVLLDLGGTSNSFWKRGFKVPNMEPELFPFGSFTRWIISQVLVSVSGQSNMSQPPTTAGLVALGTGQGRRNVEKDENGEEFQGMLHINELRWKDERWIEE